MRTMIFALLMSITSVVFVSAQSRGTRSNASANSKTSKASVNYSVNWGPDLKLKGDEFDKILLYRDGSFYAIINAQKGAYSSVKGISAYIAKFNKNMELELQKKVEAEKNDKKTSGLEIVKIFEFNNEIYLVSDETDMRSKKVLYYIENIDLASLDCKGNKKLVCEIDYAEDKNRENDNVTVLVNKDKNSMIIYDQPVAKKQEAVEVHLKGLDKNLEEVWHRDVTLPLTASKGQDVHFKTYVDNAPNLYLVSKVFVDDGSRRLKDVKQGELNYDYHIYTFGKDIPTFVDYAFNLKDKAVKQVELDVNKKGELIACGYYSDILTDKDKTSDIRGFFFTTIDPVKKTIKSQSYKKFDNNVFTAGLSARKADKQEEKLEEGKEGNTQGFNIDDLIPRKDGGSTIVMEQAYTYYVTTTSQYGSYTITNYIYNNIILTKVNASGEIEWTAVIPKRQHYVRYPLIGSYFCFDEGNDTYDIYFNDDKDNLNETYLEAKGADVAKDKLKNLCFVRVVVNPDGTTSKREEAFKMDKDDEDTHFYPTASKSVSDNEVVLFGIEHRKQKFAKISYRGLESIK